MYDLLAARDELKSKLLEYPGVFNVKDNYNIGKEELNITLLPAAANYGVTMVMLAMQVRQAFLRLGSAKFSEGQG